MKITLHRFKEATSTNDLAATRAREGGEEGEVFVADAQTAGRGRVGRAWESPKGKNLYVSLLLRPPLEPSAAPLLTLVAGAAIFDALSGLLADPAPLKIKWPNDVYYENRKIAGVLTEMGSHGPQVAWVVVGVGLNLNAEAADFSENVRGIATSVKIASGRESDREGALTSFLKSFERRYRDFLDRGPGPLIDFCNRHSYLKGKKVRWEDGTSRTGTALDLSPEGRLQIRSDDGGFFDLNAGEVTLCS